ncbi:hypothetical protein QQ056_01830 [Oscillatoria laete-virens NRMC-F 0139]|nr:hypothetical protein [Oscillatoria laete-virens]MDL5052308.1 hypothetical protein [Oscillatoria laete-virens NRMC-F 0139]
MATQSAECTKGFLKPQIAQMNADDTDFFDCRGTTPVRPICPQSGSGILPLVQSEKVDGKILFNPEISTGKNDSNPFPSFPILSKFTICSFVDNKTYRLKKNHLSQNLKSGRLIS